MAQKKSGPIGRYRAREGACASRLPSCGGQGPQVEPCSRQEFKIETVQFRIGEGDPWDSRDVKYYISGGCLISLSLCRRGFQDLFKVSPSSLFMVCGCTSSPLGSPDESVHICISRKMFCIL